MRRQRQATLRLLALGVSLLAARTLQAVSISEVGSVTSQNTESGYGSAVIDPANDFGYFGSSNTVANRGIVTRIKLSDMSYSSFLRLSNHTTNFTAAAIDTTGGFAYFISSQTPSIMTKIDLGTFTTVSSQTLPSNYFGSSAAIRTSTVTLFAVQTGTPIIVAVRDSDLSIVAITSVTAASEITSSVIDLKGGFAYFGSSTSTSGYIAKISLVDFSLVASLRLRSGEGAPMAAAIDTVHGFAYFATSNSPPKIIQVKLSDFSESGSNTLDSSVGPIGSGVLDPVLGYAYFGTMTSPGKVLQISLGNLTVSTSLTLNSGEDNLASAAIDTSAEFAYFGTYTFPGSVVKIDLLSGAPSITLQPSDLEVKAGQDATFTVIAQGRNPTYQWQQDNVDISGATSAGYTKRAVTLADDGSTFHCSVITSSGTTVTRDALLTVLPVVRAFPNPWRSDRHTGIPITFDGLPLISNVKIFTLGAHWVTSVPSNGGTATWNRTNDSGQEVASGYYLYVVKSNKDRQTVHGKFAIIK